ncbi:MAG: cyclomaltodextrinase N-terminal domain-containing protein, partial [Flavobacteriaceae bacterium]
MKRVFAVLFVLFALSGQAQLERVEPPYWWEGMENPNLQLLLYGNNIAQYDVTVPSLEKVAIHRVVNPNYLFVDLDLSGQQAGRIEINLHKEGKVQWSSQYEIKKREQRPAIDSFNATDVIYLLMPDRFANGDPSNDAHPSVTEQPNRKDKDGRHGGDIQGIINHLDYLEELGVSALW